MTKRRQRLFRVLWIALPFVLCLGALLGAGLITRLGALLPPCTFRSLTGLLCPGCGNTHAVLCLLRGEIGLSFCYNPFPLFCLGTALLFYTEVLLRLFGKKTKLVPRKPWFWIVTLVLFAAFYILRNFYLPYLPN